MPSTSHTARYQAERPHLDQALITWRSTLERIAQEVDRAAVVSGRVKSHRSVIGKVFRRPGVVREWESLGDLVGLKAIFPTTSGVARFTEIVQDREDFHPRLEDKKSAADKLAYESKQFDLWRDDVVDSRGSPVKIEVQVRTAASDAWYVVDHRLRYKGIVELPEDLERKVLRLTVLAELFDQEVEAVIRSQSTLAEYGIARAYARLTDHIDQITGGLASTSRPDGLMETLLQSYDSREIGQLESTLESFVQTHGDHLEHAVKSHMYESPDFIEARDWLYSEPEAILIAERAIARPAMLKDAIRCSNYESLILPMIDSFRTGLIGGALQFDQQS